ncbi:MAG: PEP-CTERM sorting domain-containing protein [Akkermansiaceae bacterium]
MTSSEAPPRASKPLDGSGTAFTGGSVFAYNYAQNYDDRNGSGDVPPGNDSSSSTDFYFTLNATAGDVAGIQTIDLSSGATATTIAAGNGVYDIRGYFTNYSTDAEGGRLTLEFYDGDPGADGTGATLLGSAINFDDTDLTEWTEIGGTGAIDSSAQWARIVLEQDPLTGTSGGGPDVYADNITFEVNAVPEPSSSLLSLAGASLLVMRRRRG